ncbi:hypothetical protein PRIPAC_93122 [Pristionchus pacificus]|uniref:Uncharacterized protein n=1 Tax=Pristionchus pacificus TaxID=54126 RepID=A0A2A6CD21_PRIPA|nr:hypothetical protein PRIPAC_93122 [Pristionchus pacificus]|eukprot:PDM75990.1 hypothetical protein PRIPAC_39594 [Pristionchus pacificus]
MNTEHDRSAMADDSASSIGDDQAINVKELVATLVESDSETPLGDSPLLYEGHDVPLPEDSDDWLGDETVDAGEQEVSGGSGEENRYSAEMEGPGGSGEEEKPKRKPISFGTHSPPPLKEARKQTSILATGKFARGYNQTFINSSRKPQPQNQGQEEEEENDGAENYRGM